MPTENIDYTDKTTGDNFTADDANDIKSAVNTNADELDTKVKREGYADTVSFPRTQTRRFANQTVAFFIDDDGHKNGFDILRPLFNGKNVPCNLAVPIVSVWPEETSNPAFDNSNHLTPAQLDTLVNGDGWGLSSHSITFENLVSGGLTQEQVAEQISGSKDIFNQKGYSPTTFTYPQGSSDLFVRQETQKHYRSGFGVKGPYAPNTYPIYTYDVRRYRFDALADNSEITPSYQYFKDIVDENLKEPSLLVFMTHSEHDNALQNDFVDKDGNLTDLWTICGQIIDYMKQQDIPILTIDDALDIASNTHEDGDQGGEFTESFAVGANGRQRFFRADFNSIHYGRDSGRGSTQGNHTTFGHLSGVDNTGDTQTAVGYFAGNKNSGNSATHVGVQAGVSNTGNFATHVGRTAGFENTGRNHSAFGYNAGYKNTGDDCSHLGYRAGEDNNQDNHTAFGYLSGIRNTGEKSCSFGGSAGYENTGEESIQVGYRAGLSNTGVGQTAVGSFAGLNNSGGGQTAIGRFSARNASGGFVTALGEGAADSSSGANVTFLGYRAGRNNTAADCVGIGKGALIGNATAGAFQIKVDTYSSALIEGDFVNGGLAIGAPSNANKLPDTRIEANRFTFYVDEATNKLHVRVKYANGTTIKEGEVNLV